MDSKICYVWVYLDVSPAIWALINQLPFLSQACNSAQCLCATIFFIDLSMSYIHCNTSVYIVWTITWWCTSTLSLGLFHLAFTDSNDLGRSLCFLRLILILAITCPIDEHPCGYSRDLCPAHGRYHQRLSLLYQSRNVTLQPISILNFN